jgi:hypothetical protein
MKKHYLLTAAVCCFFVPQIHAGLTCAADPENVVANCGFETGDFTSWTLAGNDVPGEQDNLYGVEGTDPYPTPDGTDPNGGAYQAFFSDQYADPTTLSQSLTTVPGYLYHVSFFLAQQLVGPGTVHNDVVVSFGGTTLATLTNLPVEGYTFYTYDVVASGATSTLSLQFGNDIGEFLVDDIDVSVPDPSPLQLTLILAAMLGGVVFFERRKRLFSRPC